MEKIAKGVYPVMITPFTADNQVDWEAVDQIVEFYAKLGCDGIFAVCQSSEMFFLTEDEREQLAARGIRPQDLGYVLFSHLDPDHIAGISEVRGAKRLLVPEEEYFWSCRINLRYTSRRLWIDEPPERFWYRVNHIGPESRSYDLFGDDSVHLVHIAGHTEGMFAALIRNGERYVLLNADGAASPRSWAEGTVPGICENSVRAKKALNWIGSMSRDPACVASLCSHDPDIAPQTIEF